MNMELIRQYNFPERGEYPQLLSADHDRCQQWDYDHFSKACKTHMGTGEMYIATFVRVNDHATVIEFLKDVLKADPKKNWTGYCVSKTINRSSGYPIYNLALFANENNVKVTSKDGSLYSSNSMFGI